MENSPLRAPWIISIFLFKLISYLFYIYYKDRYPVLIMNSWPVVEVIRGETGIAVCLKVERDGVLKPSYRKLIWAGEARRRAVAATRFQIWQRWKLAGSIIGNVDRVDTALKICIFYYFKYTTKGKASHVRPKVQWRLKSGNCVASHVKYATGSRRSGMPNEVFATLLQISLRLKSTPYEICCKRVDIGSVPLHVLDLDSCTPLHKSPHTPTS